MFYEASRVFMKGVLGMGKGIVCRFDNKQEYFELASRLNMEYSMAVDIVTIMGFMSLEECERHVSGYEKILAERKGN